jgi:hypothetical protein
MHEGDPRGQLRAGLRGAAADRMCTSCHGQLAEAAAVAKHTKHDPAGAGARCVGCHMPRIVYGVLDVHRSHRIEVPRPERNALDGRPDACAGCHVQRSSEPVFTGDPVTRAIAADALGRAQVPLAPEERARRAGLLLEVMAGDTYPAVRHLAARALGRLGVDGAAAFDPSAPADERAAAVARLRARLGPGAVAPPPAEVAALRARAPRQDVDIGE